MIINNNFIKPLYILYILFLTISLEANYELTNGHRELSKIDTMPKNHIDDSKVIPQDLTYYAKQVNNEHAVNMRLFKELYFNPWTINKLEIEPKYIGWERAFIKNKPIYTEDRVEIEPKLYNRWIHNAQYSKIDTERKYAITTISTNLKTLPTTTSYYRDPNKTGEGFPFDYNQNSSLHINIPLYISHYSYDGKWAYVKASYAFGWIKIEDIALVDEDFIKRFKNMKLSVTTKDNIQLNLDDKKFSIVKLGSIFPKDINSIYVSSSNIMGKATLKPLQLKSKSFLADMPLKFNSQNVAKIAQEFYGEPYGWGGGYECRDCSTTTRDFFTPFGIFLQRNSTKQAKDGISTDIKRLSKDRKKKAIVEIAQPFKSLLYTKGHVMLYLGDNNGEPVIMHTYWGVRKNDGTKHITGRTIISTTEPGAELPNVKEKAKLINTIKAIVNF